MENSVLGVGFLSFCSFLLVEVFFPVELLGSTDGWVLETIETW